MDSPNTYLIKRSGFFRELKRNNSKKKWYFEIKISPKNAPPPSVNIKPEDIVYIAETSGGIYAKGRVIESGSVKEFDSLSELLNFSKRYNDDKYWMQKIRQFSERNLENRNVKLRFHEYCVNQKLLKRTIPYNGPLEKYDASVNRGIATIFFKLTKNEGEYLENNPNYKLKKIDNLKSDIPGDLRLKVWSFFSQNSSIGHIVDIDHFVPKSVGGPGNIIENLVPYGFSLNRSKSDFIPRSFFEVVASKDYIKLFNHLKKDLDKILETKDKFIRPRKVQKSKEIAQQINSEISNWSDIDKIKQFYYKVNKEYNPDYVKLIKQLKL